MGYFLNRFIATSATFSDVTYNKFTLNISKKKDFFTIILEILL